MSASRQRALITGASAGLGVEFAHQLAARGVDLVLVARRGDRLAQVAEEVRARHAVEVTTVAADLADRGAVDVIAAAVGDRPVDWLVNNAGSSGPHLLSDAPWEAQAAYLELMTLSITHLCWRFVPGMRERGFGRVVNVASFAGRLLLPHGAHYGPSKAYVIAFSEELALILRGTNVHVTALCPGFVHTDFHAVNGLEHQKRATPSILWYDAATVVRDGLTAVERGRSIVISGRLYRWLDPLTRFWPTRRLLQRIAGRTAND